MAADAEGLLQVADVLQHGQHFEAGIVQAEEDAHADIIDASLHGPVHGRKVVEVVGFRPLGVHPAERVVVVRLLEELVGADAGLLQLAVGVHRQGGDVDVDAADLAVAPLHAVYRLNGFQRVGQGGLAQPLPETSSTRLWPWSTSSSTSRRISSWLSVRRVICVLLLRKAQYRQSLVHMFDTYSGANNTRRLP